MSLKGYELINCPLCNSLDSRLMFKAPVQNHQKGIFSFDEWNIVKCANCDLVYVNPRITEEVNFAFYQFTIMGDQKNVNDYFITAEKFHTSKWDRMVRVIQTYQDEGCILDVGCGNGAFLLCARSKGYHVFGEDVSTFFINLCHNSYDLDVFLGSLEDLHLPVKSFDVITCFDVIEHSRNPKKLINEIQKILKPNGILVLSTHDIGSFGARFYGKKWRMIYPIGHLLYFSKNTIAKLLVQNGFTIERVARSNIIDKNKVSELINLIKSFMTTIVLRSLILFIYKPLANTFPFFKNWKIHCLGKEIDHNLLLFLTGNQLITDDELIIIARSTQH